MLAQLTAVPRDRQPQSGTDQRTLPDLSREELARLRSVVDGMTAILDMPNRQPAGPVLQTAVAVRRAATELGELRDRLAKARAEPCRAEAA
jgi:hypothetical protein